jgi:YesN/AraC family two-component response regulator
MKPSVLIVDDEKVICDGLERLLSSHYITYQASSGQEALDIIKSNENIDVVLCDLVMPGMDGNTLIETVRAENSHISMIVMTAFSDPNRVCDAMKKGANNFLLKPLDIELLETSIKNAVNRKKPLRVSAETSGMYPAFSANFN